MYHLNDNIFPLNHLPAGSDTNLSRKKIKQKPKQISAQRYVNHSIHIYCFFSEFKDNCMKCYASCQGVDVLTKWQTYRTAVI